MKKRSIIQIVSLLMAFLVLVPALPSVAEEKKITRMEAIKSHVENALKYGRNIPGSKEPKLFIEGMNIETHEPIKWKKGGKTYVPAEFMGGQNLMRLLYGLTALTGEQKYKEIAKEQYKYYFDNFTDNNGLLYWGCHAFVDVMTGKPITDGNAHEVKYAMLPYDIMFDADPKGAKRYVEALWNAHCFDMSNMRLDRHGYFNVPMQDLWDSEYLSDDPLIESIGPRIPFFCTVNDLIDGAVALAKYTGDQLPIVWADRMYQRRAELTDPDTGLVGSQFGTYGDGGDRAYVQFGPEYGENFLESNWISRDGVKAVGYDPYALIPYAEYTNRQDVKDALVKLEEGFQEYIYDPVKHMVRTPMLTDGTSMEGLVVPRDGYFGNEGTVFHTDTVGGSVFAMEFNGPILVYTKVAQSEKIWQFIRDFARNIGIGDVGTAPGENVNLNMESPPCASYYAIAMVDLYNFSGCKEYLDLAELMADRIIKAHFRNGVFSYWANSAYTQFGSQEAVAIMIVEAAVQGKSDLVTNFFTIGSFDTDYDGYGRTNSEVTTYNKKLKKAESIEIDKKEMSLVVDTNQILDFEDTKGHWAQNQIREMVSAGIMTGRDDGKFYPNDYVVRAEFAKMVNTTCSFSDTTMPLAWYKDVSTSDWYYQDALKAKNAKLFSNEMTLDQYFGGNEVLTREQMASVLVRALKKLNPKTDYTTSGSLTEFKDADKISDWAKEYMDIAYSQRIINGTSDTTLDPQLPVTRAQAACAIRAFQNVFRCEDVSKLSATISNKDCTDTRVTWESSDKNVVEVDANGNLYPIGVGEATITARSGEATDTSKITVDPVEDWMIKKIKINGVKLEEFEPTKFEYNIDLPIGTKQVPDIEAISYSGAKINIAKPLAVPGTVTLYLKGGDAEHTYKLNFTANKIEYIVNTDFDSATLGARAIDLRDGELLWSVYHTNYINRFTVVEKPLTEAEKKAKPEAATEDGMPAPVDKCLKIQYDEKYKYLFEGRAKFTTAPIKLGEEAEADMLAVFDFDMMFDKDAMYTLIRIGNGKTFTQLHDFRLEGGSTFFSLATNSTAAKYTIGKFTNVKFVVDERTKKLDIYIDGKKSASNLPPTDANVSELSCLEFNMRVNLPTAPALYVDNIKIYEVSRDGLEASFER